jgi:hypothetical protein
MIGGKIYLRPGVGKIVDCYNLKIRDRKIVKELLELLLPFLVTRKVQAQGVLTFLNTPISDSERQTEIYELMRIINKKGIERNAKQS